HGRSQQYQQPVANQVGGGLLPAHHGDDDVGDDLLLGQPVPILLGGQKRVDEAIAGVRALPANGGTEVGGHLVHAAQHARGAVRVVLKVPEHFGEVLRPRFELVAVSGGHAQQLGGDDGRQGVG